MTAVSEYSKVTPELEQLASLCRANNTIDPQDYVRYDVKRGLRDLNGNGVVAGLTEISEVHAKEKINGESVPVPGKLFLPGLCHRGHRARLYRQRPVRL